MSDNEPIRESNSENEGFEFNDNFPADFLNLIKECGGCSFRNGLYRTHTLESSIKWGLVINKYFPSFAGCLPFGYDWMGRQFCIHKNSDNILYMLDPSTGEGFIIKSNINDFHNKDLINEVEDFLSESLFIKILDLLKLKRVAYKDCLGYKIPLFLGGADSVENYELIDMEVYCEIQCQLFSQI
jgi:hypothetical protein